MSYVRCSVCNVLHGSEEAEFDLGEKFLCFNCRKLRKPIAKQEPTTSPVSGVQATEARGVLEQEAYERWLGITPLKLQIDGNDALDYNGYVVYEDGTYQRCWTAFRGGVAFGTGSENTELSPPAAETATSSSSKEALSSSKEVREVLERLYADVEEGIKRREDMLPESYNLGIRAVLSIINRYLEETK